MKKTKLHSIWEQLNSAHRVTVDDGCGEHELIAEYSVIFNENDHEVIFGRYRNGEVVESIFSGGNEVEVSIDEQRVSEATIVHDGFIIVNNLDGTHLTFRMYHNPKPITPVLNWE